MHQRDCLRASTLALLCLSTLTSQACGGDDLPEIMRIREFSLVDQDGAELRSEALRGRIWIASFFFTSCTSICPMLTHHVANLHRRLGDAPEVRFVSFSVDPDVDTTARLTEYARRYDADLARWTFVTGPREDVRRVVVEILRSTMGDRVELRAGYDIPHSGALLLVDGEGVVRGEYDTSSTGLAAIERDARRLARQLAR